MPNCFKKWKLVSAKFGTFGNRNLLAYLGDPLAHL